MIEIESDSVAVSSLSVDVQSETLVLSDEKGRQLIEINNSFSDFERPLDLGAYEVILFHRVNWPEAQLWTIQEGGKDVGHVFSIAALASSNPTIREDRYARHGAVVALKRLALGMTLNTTAIKPCMRGSRLDIDQLYGENLVVAIISHERIYGLGHEVSSWSQYISDRLPGFSSVGLHFQREVTSRQTFDVASTTQQSATNLNVHLRGIHGLLPAPARQFLHEVVLSIVPFQEHPAFRFFLCYQMLEVLIEDLTSRVLHNFVQTASNQSTLQAKASIKGLNDCLRESVRVSRLLHANDRPLVIQLGKASNEVLSAAGQKTDDDMAACVYALRNMLFHNFKSAHSYGMAIEKASDLFFQVLCELAVSYEVPSAHI